MAKHTRTAKSVSKPRAAKKPGHSKPVRDFPVVGVGASAGGLEAFTRLLQHLPSDTGMAFVLIQHLDPKHESMLPQLLSRATTMPVLEAVHRMKIRPNHVYVNSSNFDVTLEGPSLLLARRADANRHHMPIDLFFESLAKSKKNRAIGVILSGTASDGTAGLAEIKAAGGLTFAQDKNSAKFDGMPSNAIAAGVVDFVLRPQEIGRELGEISRHSYLKLGLVDQPPRPALAGKDDVSKIFSLLRAQGGSDFSGYKRGTIDRRLRRRMALVRAEDISGYIKVLQENRDEVKALCEDFLINVTEFFRDPKTFIFLQAKIFPKLLKDRSPDAPIRIWTPGCSTGEESYSIAMLLLDYLSQHDLRNQIQVFGTDVSAAAISRARAGQYGESAVKNVSPDYLHQFFLKVDQGYRVSKRVREVCIFARQDLAKDPPFSRMDMISCRNVLIYLEHDMQNRLVRMFHYALEPNGYLVLGKSESLGGSPLFAVLDRTHKIYTRQPVSDRPLPDFPVYEAPAESRTNVAREPSLAEFDVEKEADSLVLAKYAPPGVVINEQMEIIQFRGDMSPFLQPVAGRASLNFLKIVREDMVAELHAAVDMALRGEAPVRREGLKVNSGDQPKRTLNIDILPIKTPQGRERLLLVLFETASVAPPSLSAIPPASAVAGEISRLQQELVAARKHLHFLMDERQVAEEELRSANEEILSSNEELQSANEELGTSQEELQSANEELSTVNDELQNRNTELAQLSNDLNNLINSVNIPIVMLGNDLRVRRFTPMAGRVLNLRTADIDRPLMEINTNLEVPDLEKLLSSVVEDLSAKEREVQDRNGAWYSLRLRPYRTEDHKIDGVVMVLYDIDQLKRGLDEVQTARDFSQAIVETVPGPLVVLDSSFRVMIANGAFYDTFHLRRSETKNALLKDLGSGQWNVPALQDALRRALPENLSFEGVEISGKFRRVGQRIISVAGRVIDLGESHRKILLVSMTDITVSRRTEDQMRKAHSTLEKSLQHAKSSLHESEQDLRQNRAELRALAARLLSTQEEERRRVSRELHDDLNQKLAMLEVDAERLGQQLTSSPAIVQKVKSLQTLVAEVSNDVRRVAYQLHPSILDHLGLAVALRSYCSEFSKRERIRVLLSTEDAPESVPEAVALCLYRLTQESLRNVAKHASAKSASVKLRRSENGVHLTIKDNGVGFDPAAKLHKGGIGLLSMKERVRLVDGEFTLQSKPGKGTQIDVWAPLPNGDLPT